MSSWQEKAEAKRRALAEAIPPEWRLQDPPPETQLRVIDFPEKSGLFTKEELEITSCDATMLIEKLAGGEYTAVAVTKAFCHRAAVAQQLVNCLAEIFFDKALAQAAELDEHLQQHGKPVGPLHGLPVSLKDQFSVQGVETAMGYVGWLGPAAPSDSELTACLRAAGAVFFVKTAVAQSLMIGETLNNISGRALNPHSRALSPGGSSGGEGALLALRGAPLGAGTDLGGSVRMPAAFNALCGLRPSHGRLPYAGAANSYAGQESVPSVCGPLAPAVPALAAFARAVLAQAPWERDPHVVPLPWRADVYAAARARTRLSIGVLARDGVVEPHPPVARALAAVRAALEAAGHDVRDVAPLDHARGVGIFNRVFADGGRDIRDALALSGEPPIPNIRPLLDPPRASLTLNEAWALNVEKGRYVAEYMAYVAERYPGLDAVVMPVAPHAAVRHDHYYYYGYTAIVNLLDWTSCVVPVGFASKALDPRDERYAPKSELDRLVWEDYVPEIYDGAPTAVQVVGKRLTEEKILGVAEVVAAAIKRYGA